MGQSSTLGNGKITAIQIPATGEDAHNSTHTYVEPLVLGGFGYLAEVSADFIGTAPCQYQQLLAASRFN